jgi:predicted nucleic acid-binding protein
MRIVFDTNVLVAGLLSPFGPCGEIVRMVSSGEVTLCFDALILAEYGFYILKMVDFQISLLLFLKKVHKAEKC